MSSSPLKKLAGETAIYGFSTIFARIVNFIFFPIYTYKLTTENYGIATEFLAYIAILQVVLTLGLETGCFRFANKESEPNKVFSNALLTTGMLSLAVFLGLYLFSEEIANWLGYGSFRKIIVYVAGTLALDSFTSILFAKLRFENRPVKFAIFKSIKISCEILFNLALFFIVPLWLDKNPDSFLLSFISPKPDFTYILFAIFLSSIVSLLIFIPDILKIRLSFNSRLWKQMMLYSLPIMVAGLPGILNDFIDRPLFRFFSPEGNIWESDLGIFQAGTKVATFMMLFIQMFRFAAEPFFFSREKEKDSKQLYAKVMEHFTALGVLIFLGIMFYLDIIQYIVGRDFREGLSIVPIMLLSYLILGISFNVSMWYKLSGKTNYAILITSAGLPVTLAINIIFMPVYSYHAAAWGHFASYLVMLLTSIWLGNKYYPIPYRWIKVIGYIAVGAAMYAFVIFLPETGIWVKYTIRTVLIISYILFYLKQEKISIWRLKL